MNKSKVYVNGEITGGQIREPTEENKKLIKNNGLSPDRWLVVWEDKDTLEVISKRTRRRRVLNKGGELG